MHQHPIEQAINEQVGNFVPEKGIDRGIKYKRLTKQQIFRSRRPTETIMVGMADKMKTWKKSNPDNQKIKRNRRRQRGPRVLVAIIK